MSHTPGPWRIKTEGNFGNCVEADCGKRLFDGDTGHRTVATFQSCEPTGLWKNENENALSNARLIAAAPELLLALQAWVSGCGDEHFSTKDQCRKLIEQSGDLIAKVLGK